MRKGDLVKVKDKVFKVEDIHPVSIPTKDKDCPDAIKNFSKANKFKFCNQHAGGIIVFWPTNDKQLCPLCTALKVQECLRAENKKLHGHLKSKIERIVKQVVRFTKDNPDFIQDAFKKAGFL